MRFALPFIAALLLVPAPSKIENERDYRERMDAIDHSFAELQKHRVVRTGAGVGDEAEKLSELFDQVHTFWKARGDEEAAGFAQMAKEGADAVLDADRAGEQKALDAAIATIASACEGCHKDPLDKYRFRRE